MRMIASLVALGVLCTALPAGENPQVKVIHEEIKVLKAEEKVTLKTIHAWYESFIKRDKLTKEVVDEERKILKKQEEALLSIAATAEARKVVHAQYDGLRALLRADSKIDAEVVRELRRLEKNHETYVGDVYKSKILVLESAAKAAASAKPKK
jgi:predicted MPP superfamily phosphohydrolase